MAKNPKLQNHQISVCYCYSGGLQLHWIDVDWINIFLDTGFRKSTNKGKFQVSVCVTISGLFGEVNKQYCVVSRPHYSAEYVAQTLRDREEWRCANFRNYCKGEELRNKYHSTWKGKKCNSGIFRVVIPKFNTAYVFDSMDKKFGLSNWCLSLIFDWVGVHWSKIWLDA